MEAQERSSSKVGPSRVQSPKKDQKSEITPLFGTHFECFWGLILRTFLEPPFFRFFVKTGPQNTAKMGSIFETLDLAQV